MIRTKARLYLSASFLTLASPFITPVFAMIENETAATEVRANTPCNILDVALEGRRPTAQELQEKIRLVAKGAHESHGNSFSALFQKGRLTIEGSGETLTKNSSTPIDTTLDEATIRAVDWTGLYRIDAMVQSITALQALVEKVSPTTALYVEIAEIVTPETVKLLVPLFPRVAHLFLTVDRAATAVTFGDSLQPLIADKVIDPKEKNITMMVAGDFLEDVTFKGHTQPSQKATVDGETLTRFKTLSETFGNRKFDGETFSGFDILSLNDLFSGGVEAPLSVDLRSSVAGTVAAFRPSAIWSQVTPSDTTLNVLLTWNRLRPSTIQRLLNWSDNPSIDGYNLSRKVNIIDDEAKDYVRLLRAMAEIPSQMRENLDKALIHYCFEGDTCEEREALLRYVQDQPLSLEGLKEIEGLDKLGASLTLSYLKSRATLTNSIAGRIRYSNDFRSLLRSDPIPVYSDYRSAPKRTIQSVLQKLTPPDGPAFVRYANTLATEETNESTRGQIIEALSKYPVAEWESLAQAVKQNPAVRIELLKNLSKYPMTEWESLAQAAIHILLIKVGNWEKEDTEEKMSALQACEPSRREAIALDVKRLTDACRTRFSSNEGSSDNNNPLRFKVSDVIASLNEVPVSEREDVNKRTEAWIANLDSPCGGSYNRDFSTSFMPRYISLLASTPSKERESFTQTTKNLFRILSSGPVVQSGGRHSVYHTFSASEKRSVFIAGASLLGESSDERFIFEHIYDLMALPAGSDREILVRLARPLVVIKERRDFPLDSKQSIILNLAQIPAEDREDVVSKTKDLVDTSHPDYEEVDVTRIMRTVAGTAKIERPTLVQQMQPLLTKSLSPERREEMIKWLAPLESTLRAEVIKLIKSATSDEKLYGKYAYRLSSIASKLGKEGLPDVEKNLLKISGDKARLSYLETLNQEIKK